MIPRQHLKLRYLVKECKKISLLYDVEITIAPKFIKITSGEAQEAIDATRIILIKINSSQHGTLTKHLELKDYVLVTKDKQSGTIRNSQ